ncbi:uncharacterized protein [Physcomitrium patens]|uniref:uncharacterized protein isoform X2 n=1 Tax=Physcomitrium patens TaxID=3218 RepID=UPI003CCD724D
MQDYQPILVGAGCPALGYMYGRHCRFHLGNLIDVSTASEAACCKQTESGNYVSEHATVHHRKSSAMRPARCPTESALKYLEREFAENPERCAKRDLGHLEIRAPHNIHLKQEGAARRREEGYTKPELEQDVDDETVAQRLRQ